MPLPPENDDELPPPPSDMTGEVRHYAPIKTKKSGSLATVRRAFVIFEKDIRTMAKHGLVSSVILFVFLLIVFSIMSFAMKQAMSFDIGEMMGGDEFDAPWATEATPPVANAGHNVTVDAGEIVTLDASGSYDNDQIIYYIWHFYDGVREVELYGEQVEHPFNVIGEYVVYLTVVDYSVNQAENNITVTVEPATSDWEQPTVMMPESTSVPVGTPVTFDGSTATDNVGVVNWTWTFHDVIERVLYGESPSYTFSNAGREIWIMLTVSDEAGNSASGGTGVFVEPLGESPELPWADIEDIGLVTLGNDVTLDGSRSSDVSGGMSAYIWYIEHNATYTMMSGEVVDFEPEEWGMYSVTLMVRDASGNYETSERDFIVAPAGVDADAIAWTSTPFGVDVSFNLLTYAYGVALLSSVIFVGGLFSKGFSHEIQKGTIKVLFFGPISVTTTVFSKILYPIVVGPFLIFPLVLASLATFEQDPGQVFTITLVAYLLAAVTMVAAAYGACLIYAVANRMVLKPPVVSRMFLYFSLLGTLTVFEWLSLVMDMWLKVDTYGDMYDKYAGSVALASPFHQGGIYLSNAIMGTTQNPDWMLLLIPALLIVFGILASRRLYPDLFSRE